MDFLWFSLKEPLITNQPRFQQFPFHPRWQPRCRFLQVRFVQNAEDILSAERLIFPGVGAFGACVDALQRKGFMEPLRSEDGARNDGEW